jgi:hypothetical protein
VTSENRILVLVFIAMFGWCVYVLGRMLFRREALVRDGWAKWSWEPASIFPGSYAYGFFITTAMLAFSAWATYVQLKDWLR